MGFNSTFKGLKLSEFIVQDLLLGSNWTK